MKNRKSYATSMGLTALDGLMMGQRCGNLDAGVVLHLIQECEMTVDEVQHLLYFESGLLGVSGISNDMHVLQNSASQYAKLAIDLFCYRAARELAALANDLLGLDAIIFTAGIGENSSLVRRDICERLAWLGVKLDDNANETNLSTISTPESEIKVLVIPTDEESIIAQATNQALIKQNNC
jgi:acetate kinase